MRIAWGVMGYGRGHAMRTLSVLPALAREHEITVFTAGDAYEVLARKFPTVRIPMIGYRHNDRGGHSLPRTLAGNLGPVTDLLLRGRATAQLERELVSRGTELVISDSEAWTHRAARRLGLPRISFDHVGILAYCKPHFPPDLWAPGMRDAFGYRALMGVPERILISSFYAAEPAYPGMRIVGPMLRDEVLAARPKRGDYLLCYFNKGEHQYQAHIDRALRLLDLPVVIYGTPYVGKVDNLDFRAPGNAAFVRDLAGCRALLGTAGNQSTGEAIHFGKPILALPEDAFEQRLREHDRAHGRRHAWRPGQAHAQRRGPLPGQRRRLPLAHARARPGRSCRGDRDPAALHRRTGRDLRGRAPVQDASRNAAAQRRGQRPGRRLSPTREIGI